VTLGAARCDGSAVGSLFPEERAALAGAVPARLAEFAAGRLAARQALGQDVALPMAPDRAPVWPEGVAGSITHDGGWALAAVSRMVRMLGLDLEPDAPLPNDIWDTVLLPQEQAWLSRRAEAGHWARVIFCAKECAYKAQYPLTREVFGFEVFEVTLGDGTFEARFQRDVAPFRAGDALTGRYSRGDGLILTGIVA
jgi:4'-phosphopantetheinyl transferase EntD